MAPDADHRPTVVVVRHGITGWSATGRHTSTTDVDLLPEGEEQARHLGTLLAGRTFTRVWVSPRRRARRTAELAGLLGADTIVDDELVEWDYGEVEGRTTAEIRLEQPGWTVWDGPVPGGETLARVAARVDGVIERLRADPGDALVVAHGHVLRVLAARWCRWPAVAGRHLPLEPGAVSELGWERETPAIKVWNRG